MLARGNRDAALAKTLVFATRTASAHVANIINKLEVGSRQEAVAWLVKHIPEMSDNL